ncbi:MAG: hypothetical protein F6K47_04835 [Symploca sp. SIO2E6]|nr:hypothetical protein [Symploca sp. SIO2E6]
MLNSGKGTSHQERRYILYLQAKIPYSRIWELGIGNWGMGELGMEDIGCVTV